MGTWGKVLISHLLLVIPMSYTCHYTNLCPRMSQKRAHTHKHTHTYCVSILEGWGVASDHRSASIEPRYQTVSVQDAHYQTDRVSNQVRGLVCHDRSQGRILPCIHPSSTQEVPEVCFRGQSIPISGSSVRPVTLTPHFHEGCGCCLGSVATPEHLHTELHRRLVDISSSSPIRKSWGYG